MARAYAFARRSCRSRNPALSYSDAAGKALDPCFRIDDEPGATPVHGASRMARSGTSGFRTEHDSMGELRVPADALWGAQTQRAVQNFPISGVPMPRGFIRALGLIKAAAAEVNGSFGLLGKGAAAEIGRASCRERGRRT